MSFKDLRDQPAVADQLRRSLRHGRLAHAYLLTGQRGSGKELVARTLAKALNCFEREHDSCDRCGSCKRIDGDIHPDVYWVRPESKSRRITIEQVREFARAVNLKPTNARVKVGAIVDADCMGEEASNAFLKTLEEPPAQTVILLLTAQPQRLLPTILSRCLKISLGAAVTPAESPYCQKVLAVLKKFSTRNEGGVVAAYWLLSEISKLLAEIRDETRERVEGEENLDRYEELDPKVRERLDSQMAARIEGEYRAAREEVLEEFYLWFGDVLLCVQGADGKWLQHTDSLSAVRRAAEKLTFEQALSCLEAVEQARDALTRNITETLALEVGCLRLATHALGVGPHPAENRATR